MTNERPQVVLVNRSILLNEDKEILLIKRSENDRNNPGLWECPGGKLDKGQDLTQAFEREVLEETGLLSEAINRLVYLESFVIGDGPYQGLPYLAIFSISKSLGGQLKLSKEHSDFVWATYEKALSLNLTEQTRKALIVLKNTLN